MVEKHYAHLAPNYIHDAIREPTEIRGGPEHEGPEAADAVKPDVPETRLGPRLARV
jgi:hypothetical protein